MHYLCIAVVLMWDAREVLVRWLFGRDSGQDLNVFSKFHLLVMNNLPFRRIRFQKFLRL